MSSPTIFVVSATGTVGDAVARLARNHNWTVHATTRDINSPSAKSLSSIGVKLSQGDWDDEAALEKGIAGSDFIFMNFFPDFLDLSHELRQAEGILTIAKAAGVRHVIYSSAFTVLDSVAAKKYSHLTKDSLATKVIASKQAIEESVKSFGFESWTIIRPGFFMANFLLPKIQMYRNFRQTGVWDQALLPTTQLPLVDHEDIANFVVAAFEDPAKFSGRVLEIAAQLWTPGEVLVALSAATGKKLSARYQTDEELEAALATNPVAVGQLYQRDMADAVDMEKVKSWGIPMGTFEDFLQREKKALDETYSQL